MSERLSVMYKSPHRQHLWALKLHNVSRRECEAHVNAYRDRGAVGTFHIIKSSDVPNYPLEDTAYARFCLNTMEK